MSLVEHLLELRIRLTKAIFTIIVCFIGLFPFANDIYTYIAKPLLHYLPTGTSMIATGVASPFLAPFKLVIIIAIYISMPILLYQIWAFIAPGLYKNEKRLVAPILSLSSFLFYAGGIFAYFVVFPLVFQFLTSTAPTGVTIATDIGLYLDFVILMFFAFGIAFEVPIVTILLIITGTTTPKSLASKRPYIVVGAFVIGMILTPPDIISQTLLAIPILILFELGLFFGRYMKTNQRLEKDEENEEFDNRYKKQTKNLKQKNDVMDEDINTGFDDEWHDSWSNEDWEREFDSAENLQKNLTKSNKTAKNYKNTTKKKSIKKSPKRPSKPSKRKSKIDKNNAIKDN